METECVHALRMLECPVVKKEKIDWSSIKVPVKIANWYFVFFATSIKFSAVYCFPGHYFSWVELDIGGCEFVKVMGIHPHTKWDNDEKKSNTKYLKTLVTFEPQK